MAEKSETGLPRAVMIAWGIEETPQRGPSRGLSHERIVAAGIEIADAEGLGAVTMQAVAKALGFTTMSLYRYVASKDELLMLMQDTAMKLPDGVTLPPDWQDALRAWAELVRDAYRAHPWVLEIPRGQTSVLMPNSVRAADLGMSALGGLEIDQAARIGVILVISQLAASMVELELSLADEGLIAATAEGSALLGEVITPERFPHIASLYATDSYPGGEGASEEIPVIDGGTLGVDDEFGLGLSLLIEGLEARRSAGGAADADG